MADKVEVSIRASTSAAYLTHCVADRPFVKRLDAAMSAAGIRVSLVEQIKGESTEPIDLQPQISHYLIYVISKNSYTFLREQKQFIEVGFQKKLKSVILVIIDDTEPPSNLEGVDTVEFVNWTEPEKFALSVRSLFQLMAVNPPQYSGKEQAFFALLYSHLNDLEIRMHELDNYIQGALAAEQASGPSPHWPETADATRCAIKWAVEDNAIIASCLSFVKAVSSSYAEKELPEVAVSITILVVAFLGLFDEMESFRGRDKGAKTYRELGNSASRLFASIHALRPNSEVINPAFIASIT